MPGKSRDCPLDWTALEPQKVDVPGFDVTVDRCPKCDGVFLDKGEIKRITGHDALNDLLTKHVGLDSDSEHVCPSCGQVMDAEDAGEVRVDVCLSCHGVWLDAGELKKLKATDEAAFKPAEFSEGKRHEARMSELRAKNERWESWNRAMRTLTFRKK